MSLPVNGLGDPLVALLKAEKALLAAGARGETVAEALHDIRIAIRAMIDARERRPVRSFEDDDGRRR